MDGSKHKRGNSRHVNDDGGGDGDDGDDIDAGVMK